MKNWKTIVSGSLYPIAKWLQIYRDGPSWFFALGQVLEIVAVFGLGIVAKDFDKTGLPEK